MVRGGGTYAPPQISKSTNSILMTFYSTLYKNCSHYISAICFKIGLGLAEIIRCLCTKVVIYQIIGDCAVAWTSSIEFVACMSSVNCCAQNYHVMTSVCHSIVEIMQSKGEKVMDILQTRQQHNILFLRMLAIDIEKHTVEFCYDNN